MEKMTMGKKTSFRPLLGWFLIIIGMVVLGVYGFEASVYRYRHETLTETQLTLWALQRWWAWVPALVVAGLGAFLVSTRE